VEWLQKVNGRSSNGQQPELKEEEDKRVRVAFLAARCGSE
jgi:hypothetical protein